MSVDEGGALPNTTGGVRGGASSRRRQVHRAFNTVKITLLCSFITILVLRGTIGFGNLASSQAESQSLNLISETNRIIAEIRSDSEPEEAAEQEEEETSDHIFVLGPTISGWDQQRKEWFQRNPEFSNGKPRVLLLTGSPPGPCDNVVGDYYLLKAIKNKIDYCRVHGIELIYNLAHLDSEMTGYWEKLPLLRRMMLSHPEIEWFWWMDSDAMLTDMAFDIPFSKYNDHNLVIHGYPDLLFHKKSWTALSTGSFLIRNCQWSLDLLDAWAVMGYKAHIRHEYGKILTANLNGRPDFEADDQSALVYLLLSNKDTWMEKVFIENSYYLHGYWAGLVDKYEEMIEKYHPGFGDDRWPFVTHFVGCKPCESYGEYSAEKCLRSMERAFNFADNQILKLYGFRHRGLLSPRVKRIRNETDAPLQNVDRYDFRHAKNPSRLHNLQQG